MISPMRFEFRTQVVRPGETCCVWFPKGAYDLATGQVYSPDLPAGWSYAYPGTYGAGWSLWHKQWAWEIRVARDARPGPVTINLLLGGRPSTASPVHVNVVAPAPARLVQRLERATAQTIQMCLEGGFDVELGAWDYLINRLIFAPSGSRVFSSGGARLIRTADASPQNFPNHEMFTPAGEFTLDGITLTRDSTLTGNFPLYIHRWPRNMTATAPPITVRRCVVDGGSLGKSTEANFLCERTQFIGDGGTGITPLKARYDRCTFTGTTADQTHKFLCNGADGLLLTNNRFNGTSRGFVFQTGDVVGCAMLDNYCNGVRGGSGNANECLLFEAGTNTPIPCDDSHGSRHNLAVDFWVHDCAGPAIALYGSGMHDNQFWGINAHVDNSALYVVAIGDGEIDKIRFDNVEATGALDLRGKVRKLGLGNVTFVERQQLRGNQGPFGFVYRDFNKHFPVRIDSVARSTLVPTLADVGMLTVERNWRPITTLL